ncbi:MAG: glycosyl hydrolase 2 galactose-binding domain-containing protein, partial [Bacteroidota bacterium]
MKHTILVIAFLLPMLSEAQRSFVSTRQSVQAYNWGFRQASDSTASWKPAEAPVSIHTALFKNGLIEDPFYRDNEEKLQWIEKEDWEFQTYFDVAPDVLQKKHIELVFSGIDTYAQIYLNDTLILETDNMFRTWKAEVKRLLRPTGN